MLSSLKELFIGGLSALLLQQQPQERYHVVHEADEERVWSDTCRGKHRRVHSAVTVGNGCFSLRSSALWAAFLSILEEV